MTTVIVSSALANKPQNGGNAWVVLSWVLGLRQLGFPVYLLEQIGRADCVDAAGTVTAFDDCINLAYFRQVTERFGLAGSSALIYDDGVQTLGLSAAELCDLGDAATLLLNITGHLTFETIRRRVSRAAYLDLDPGFTQFWHA